MLANKDKEKQEDWSEDDSRLFANFRANLRILRYTTDLSALALGKALGFEKNYRVDNLETGKAAVPRLKEVMAISKYFNVTIDDLLYKKVKIAFEDPQ